MDASGKCVAFPKINTPKWSDVLAVVHKWFQKHSGKEGELCGKVYTYFGSIAPTTTRGPDRFMNWVKELIQLVEKPLPLAAPEGALDVCFRCHGTSPIHTLSVYTIL